MRRLAKQDQNDKYASRRDYQTIEKAESLRAFLDSDQECIEANTLLEGEDPSDCSGFGCFLKPSIPTTATVSIYSESNTITFTRSLNCLWSRMGKAFKTPDDGEVRITISFDPIPKFVDFWGFSVSEIDVSSFLNDEDDPLSQLNQDHLAPETFFLDHTESADVAFSGCTIKEGKGSPILLKKCSYCGRHLPVDPKRPSQLSFHKHNAKISGHQNECRACKKWRINDSFNPIRTVDQLNESSIITRERKLLLREPEILQSIKERAGRGLKSIVWERFGRKCFYCKKSLKLKEVQLDHTRPLAYLWPIDEHATCLCAEHNNHKKDSFPVDFYSETQIIELAKITGLSVEQLTKKTVCEEQLANIRGDLVRFATEVDPRAFNAIARKVDELTEIDLFQELREKSLDVFENIERALEIRPDPVI